MNVWYLLLFIVGLMGAFILGKSISKNIVEPTHLLIFWFMYLTSVLTIISIAMTIYFYFTLKDKKGIPGERGDAGDVGNAGQVGKCEEGCRNQICYDKTIKIINEKVNKLAGHPDKEIIVKNLYLKNKAKQMCASEEFAQLVPYRGPNDLIKYLNLIWNEWIVLIYKAGGRSYFESVGAENDFEWLGDNPFDEIKKYDVFYWGMGQDYRPEIIEKCSKVRDGRNLPDGIQKGQPSLNKDDNVNRDVKEGRGWLKSNKMADKYSLLKYLQLVPETELVENDTQRRYYAKTADTNKPNSYTIQDFDPETKEYGLCLTGKGDTQECNPGNKSHLWELHLTGNKKGETQLKNQGTKKYHNATFEML